MISCDCSLHLPGVDLESLDEVVGGSDECREAGEAWISAASEHAYRIAARVRKGPKDPALQKAERGASSLRTAARRAYESCLNGGK